MIVRAFALMYVEAQHLLQTHPELLRSTGHCFISIMLPNSRPEELIFPPDEDRWITLRFHDVTSEVQAAMARRKRFKYQGMTEAQADKIVRFLHRWHEDNHRVKLLVHCQAGVSRSGAVAAFARDQFALNVEQFDADNNIAPNDLMLPMLKNRWEHLFGQK